MTVPSCRKCNGEWQKDEDYFRLCLVSRADTKGNPARDAILPAVKRSLKRTEGRGFATEFLQSLAEAEQFTEGGIYIRSSLIAIFQGARLIRIAEKIIRGLFYHETGKRLPSDYHVRIIYQDHVQHVSPAARDLLLKFAATILGTEARRFGTAFAYWYLASPYGWAQSHWILEFYGSREFYCFTAALCRRESWPLRSPEA